MTDVHAAWASSEQLEPLARALDTEPDMIAAVKVDPKLKDRVTVVFTPGGEPDFLVSVAVLKSVAPFGWKVMHTRETGEKLTEWLWPT